jgi:starvation-inducible DNA-binding protein
MLTDQHRTGPSRTTAPQSSQPHPHQPSAEIQAFGTVRLFPIALAHDARLESCQLLNHALADSLILHSLYKKHHC